MKNVELCNVKKVFGKDENAVWAVNGVTLSISKGEFVALVGASGSGKSTLLNLCGGLETPSSGKVLVEGIDIGTIKRREMPQFRRKNIGFVFQNYSLLPMLNLYDNIMLPLSFEKKRQTDEKEGQELLQYLGIWDQRMKYPHELSGGQQQRVAIARALINKPAIILADVNWSRRFSCVSSVLSEKEWNIGTTYTADRKICVCSRKRNRYLVEGEWDSKPVFYCQFRPIEKCKGVIKA